MNEDVIMGALAGSMDDNDSPGSGEYLGTDGLIHCSKCGVAKQKWVQLYERKFKVRCICRCDMERQKEEEDERKRQEEFAKIERLRKASLIEDKLKDATFRTFLRTANNQKLFSIIKRYVENFEQMEENQQGLLFWGPVESGKSYAAACIANELMSRRRTVVMTSFVRILSMVQDISVDESEFIDRLNAASLLIIDDLGTERNTDYALEKVYAVIDSRYRTGKPLILTTNLALKEMKETQDIRYQRIYSRIFEMCYPVMVAGDSWRRKQAAERFDQMKVLLEG